MRPSRVSLPAPLRSTPVTALRRYYGRSDSCAGGSSARDEHQHRPDPAQVSLRPVPCHDDHSVSTHQTCPGAAFTRYPSAAASSPPDGGWRFRQFDAGSSLTSGRIEFVILRTGHSPSIALHLASRRRSYRWVRAGERMPGEDFHLSVTAPLQAHVARRPPAGVGGVKKIGKTSTGGEQAVFVFPIFFAPPAQRAARLLGGRPSMHAWHRFIETLRSSSFAPFLRCEPRSLRPLRAH